MINLDSLTPGQTVWAHDTTWLYAGQVDGCAVLLEDVTADVSHGWTGYPAVTRLITAVATATTYQVTLAYPEHLTDPYEGTAGLAR